MGAEGLNCLWAESGVFFMCTVLLQCVAFWFVLLDYAVDRWPGWALGLTAFAPLVVMGACLIAVGS